MVVSSSEHGTIAASLVEETLKLARAGGLDAASLLTTAGIAPSILSSSKSRILPKQYGTLWTTIARALDDEFFGQDTHPMRSGSFVAMTYYALAAANGGQALDRAVTFMRFVLDDLSVQIVQTSFSVRLEFKHGEAGRQPTAFAYATYFILVYGLVCWLVGRRIPLLAASFQCPAPSSPDEYRLMFCDDLSFGQAASYIDLHPTFATLPVQQTMKSVKAFLRDAPANFVVKYRNPGSVAARVRRALRVIPVMDWPDAGNMATRLHLADATMRRRLKVEGYTYQSIKDDLRRDIAIAELQNGNQAIADIASRLGFSEPSGFYRAFRKWTGARPADYRMRSIAGRRDRRRE